METNTATKLDGAKLAILSNRLGGICKKMGNTLLRTGRSGVLNRAKDFSCCIVTRDCELLTAEESLHCLALISWPSLCMSSIQRSPKEMSFYTIHRITEILIQRIIRC